MKPATLKKAANPDSILIGKKSEERKVWLFIIAVLTGFIPNWALTICNIQGEGKLIISPRVSIPQHVSSGSKL
jgi:hypothetical protein